MTRPASSLASVPDDLWVNEGQAAHLSGMSPNRFKAMLPDLERRGFPRRNALNGKRLKVSILQFWGLTQNRDMQPDDRQLERWDGQRS